QVAGRAWGRGRGTCPTCPFRHAGCCWAILPANCPSGFKHTAVDVTGLFSLRENAIAKEPGSSYLKSWRCLCNDSVCDWWLRLLGVFPGCDLESGRVFGLITGDPAPGIPPRKRVGPVCNTDS